MDYKISADLYYSGNIELLNESSIAVFCSRTIPMNLFLPASDLLKEIKKKEITLISGWHSNVEKKILESRTNNLLSKVIIFLAKGIQNYKLPKYLIDEYNNDKILILSFWQNERRISKQNTNIRNKAIIDKANKILFISIQENGNLHRLFDQAVNNGKKVFILDEPSNYKWINKGALPLSKYNLEVIS